MRPKLATAGFAPLCATVRLRAWRWHGPVTPWRRTLHARERAARVARRARARPASSSGRSLTVTPCARCLVAHLSYPAAVRRLCVCVCVLQRFPASPQGASTSDSVCLSIRKALPVRFALPLRRMCSARAQLGLHFPASCTRRHHASRGEHILRAPGKHAHYRLAQAASERARACRTSTRSRWQH
jgi:hypothetical protein